jgi:hypothetical protein
MGSGEKTKKSARRSARVAGCDPSQTSVAATIAESNVFGSSGYGSIDCGLIQTDARVDLSVLEARHAAHIAKRKSAAPKFGRLKCWLGLEASMDGASLVFGPAGAGGCGGGFGSVVPLGGQDVHGQRRERCEVVAAPRAIGSSAALKMGGHRPYGVARERDWFLSRIVEKPDLTLRALLKELADRGLAVSYYALWHFLQHEGVTFKKKPSRLRTGPPGRRQAA